MTTDTAELVWQADVQDVCDVLQHPDPDPSDLPAIIPPSVLTEEAIAARILRSSITLDAMIEQQKERMRRDMEAWDLVIAALSSKRQAWRDLVKAWMLRHGVKQIATPIFVASITKPRAKKIVTDEEGAISICKGIYPKAVKIKESLVKAEFDVACDTFPDKLKGVYTEEIGEPGLTVRKKE